MDRDRVIGRGGDMPWHLPADLAHFKQTTMGKSVIMGRKTYQSISRPLPGRQNIVISRQVDFLATGCQVADSLDRGLGLAQTTEVMIIGGGEIYRLAMPIASRLIITQVDTRVIGGQVWFPEIKLSVWRELHRQRRVADKPNAFDLEFVEYQKK